MKTCIPYAYLVTECKKKVIHPAGLSAPRSNLETVEEKAKALAKGKEEGKANQLSPTRVEANQSLLEPQGSKRREVTASSVYLFGSKLTYKCTIVTSGLL